MGNFESSSGPAHLAVGRKIIEIYVVAARHVREPRAIWGRVSLENTGAQQSSKKTAGKITTCKSRPKDC